MVETLFGGPLPRRCRECGDVKPIEAFNIDASRADGRGYICRECRRTSPINTPNRVERSAARKIGMAWCKDCGKWLLQTQVRNGVCRSHQRVIDRRKYAEDADYRSRRRAHVVRRRRGVEPVPNIGIEYLTEFFEGQCAYCDDPATTWDHVHPVVNGGKTEPGNIVPCCVRCNSSKRDRDLCEWLDKTGRAPRLATVEYLSIFGAI